MAMTIRQCLHPEKLHHKTERQAYDQLLYARSHQLHPDGGGHGLRRLNVYQCGCGGWCIGRDTRPKTTPEKNASKSKPKTLSEIRRYVKRLEVQMDNYRKHRAYLFGQQIAAEQVTLELE